MDQLIYAPQGSCYLSTAMFNLTEHHMLSKGRYKRKLDFREDGDVSKIEVPKI